MELFAFRTRHDPARLAPLALPGARWTERLERALGLVRPEWAGARLVAPDLAPRIGVVLAEDQPFTGFRIVARCDVGGEGGPATRWRPMLLDPRGESIGERVRLAASVREIGRRIGPFEVALQRDPIGRVVRRTVSFEGRAVESTQYVWSGWRLASAVSTSGGSVAYRHDSRGTLVGWSAADGALHTILGPTGHLVDGVEYGERGLPLGSTEKRDQHSAGGHRRAVRGERGTTRYAFDGLGALTRIRGPELEVDYVYDPFGRLASRALRRFARAAPADTWDPPGERTLTHESRPRWTWDGPHVVHRTSTTGPTFSHAWADGLLVLTWVDDAPYLVVPGPFGEPDALLDARGEPAWTCAPRTLLLGAPDAGVRELGVPALPDHHFDPEVGLWHSLFRVFDPATARYLSPNPLGLAAGPWLHGGPLDPVRDRMRFGIGRPREPYWSELATRDFGTQWTELVLEQLVCPEDERGLRAWRPLDDVVAPDPSRWLLEQAGLIEARDTA